jgi:hypothetical protein
MAYINSYRTNVMRYARYNKAVALFPGMSSGSMYFRSLLDPTAMILQRLGVRLPSLVQLMMGRSTPRSLSGIVAQPTCDVTLSCLPAYVLPALGIAPWTAFWV